MKKRKYSYTEKQENGIMEMTEFIVFFLACGASGFMAMAFPSFTLALVITAGVAFLLLQFYKTARVINHRRKVSSQDDNLEFEEESPDGVNWWVDFTNGSDSDGDGTMEAPLASVEAARTAAYYRMKDDNG